MRCANAITQTVREIGIEVRAGLHTGEIEFVDGEVHGIAVHIGARVAALAGAGEVLVSSTVKDLIAGSGGWSSRIAANTCSKGCPARGASSRWSRGEFAIDRFTRPKS